MTRRGKTSGWVSVCGKSAQEENVMPDTDVVTNGELVLILDDIGHSGDLVTAPIDGHARVCGDLCDACISIEAWEHRETRRTNFCMRQAVLVSVSAGIAR